MIISFHPCIKTDVQIILGDRLPDEYELQLIKDADAIILPQGCSEKLFYTCSKSKAILFPEYGFRFRYPGKIGHIRLFHKLKLPYPCSMFWNGLEDLTKHWHKISHKLPFILKEDKKHEGDGVYIIRDIEDIYHLMKKLNKSEGLLTQELIEDGGNVLRVVIIGNNLFSYWKRPANPAQLITTISSDAIIDHYWMPHLQEKGEDLVKKLIHATGINLAAVDIIFKNNNPLLLEINYYFGRRGVGGTERYYQLLYEAIRDWLRAKGISSDSIKLVY